MRYIVSAGGTGGHIFPALSIINKIKEKDKDAEFIYIGTVDRMEKDIVPNMGIEYVGIKMNGLSKSLKKIASFSLNTISGFNKCKSIMKKFKPDVVIGVGGYVTFPVVLAAHKLGVKVILHEQNSIPGKANKFLSRYADTVCISMESSRKYFDHKNIVLTGNPRGEDILKGSKGKKSDYGLDVGKKLVLITMGSLGASSINEKILLLIDKFCSKSYEVLLVTGKDNYDDVSDLKVPSNVKIVPFIEDMGSVLKYTDLIVTRAGATIIAEITSLGIPSVIIPSPYVANNHQEINARDLENNEACCMILEKDFDGDMFLSLIDNILSDRALYKKLSANAKKMGITDSATRIYNEIERLF